MEQLFEEEEEKKVKVKYKLQNKIAEDSGDGLDWTEELMEEKESHFVTEREFSISLDVVMSTEYLADDDNCLQNLEDLITVVDEYYNDNPGFTEVNEIVVKNINDIFSVGPNLKQLEAFLRNICGIYTPDRHIYMGDKTASTL